MRNRVRHRFQHAARVGRSYPIARKILIKLLAILIIPLSYLHDFVLFAYSFITPPCFYSPSNQFHVSLHASLNEEKEAILISLQHKQKKLIQQHQEKRLRFILISIVLLVFTVKHHTQADAATNTSNLGVTTSVTAKCKVNSSDMAFGTYDPTGNNTLDVNGSILLNCTKNTTATISLNNGAYSSQASHSTTRAMQNTSGGTSNQDYLGYELYKDSGRSTVWNTTSTVAITATTAATTVVPVYGRIPGNQGNVKDGGYLDTVLITVNF